MPGTNQPQHGIQGLAAKLQEFTRRLTSLESWQRTMSVPASPWIAPTLLNSWADFGSGFANAGYFKDPLGLVHLQGEIIGGSSGSIAFVLPVGYRPGAFNNYAAVNGSGVMGYVQIGPTGNVEIITATGTAAQQSLVVPPFLAEN